jgi:hypothetical protein
MSATLPWLSISKVSYTTFKKMSFSGKSHSRRLTGSPRCQYVISQKDPPFHMRRKGEGSPQERFASSIALVAAAKPQMEFIQFAMPASDRLIPLEGWIGLLLRHL